VTANKCYFFVVFESVLEIVHFSKHVDAINAATGPEINNNDLVVEFFSETQRFIIFGVKPVIPSRPIRNLLHFADMLI